MSKVSSLKSLSLRVVADYVWEVLKIRSTPLEPTLGIKLTNLMNGLDGCSFHAPFLNCLKMIALVFQNVFNAKLLVNSVWNNFKVKPVNLESTLIKLNEYLSLPTSLKLELSHVLSTQYDSYNLFQMALMIEMGFYCLDFQHYLHLSGNLKLLSLLQFGKKTIKKLILRQCMYNCSACNKFTTIQTQEYLISSFPCLQELSANGTCCNDVTLSLVAKYCPLLKKLKVKNATAVTDRGIEYLYSPQSVAKQLSFLSFCNTNVTISGAEKALKNLARLETLECSTHMDTIDLLKSLSEQQLVFAGYKALTITLTEETEKNTNAGN
uniref:F-box domain-containing protein n=1 Tax=Strigamia maritima TaxID=126957 RepID=T1IRI3_STRMM